MLGTNPVKAKLKRGEVCLAGKCQFYAPGLVEFMGRCGCDVVTFDSEAGSLDISQIEDMARAVELAGAVPFCSLPPGRPEIILRTMDAGVMGVIVPHVQTREDAEAIVSYVKYPPMGHRGYTPTVRAADYDGMSAKEYVTKANNETMVIVHIEDPEGVQNIESIVKTEGVDCVLLGPNDLALSMGYPGQMDAPEVQEAIEKVLSATLNAGLTFMAGADERTGPQWIKRGARLITINIVHFFRRKWTEMINGLRESGAS